MSRTYRKPKIDRFKSESVYVDEQLNYLARRVAKYGDIYNQVRIRKSREEYESEVAKEKARYEEDCRQVRKRYWYCCNNPDSFMYSCYLSALPKSYRYYVSKYRYEYRPVDWDAERKDAKTQYAKRTRDGYCNETGRNRAYKTLSKETVRGAVKRLERRIVKGEEWEHLPYPDTYLGKKHIWDVW